MLIAGFPMAEQVPSGEADELAEMLEGMSDGVLLENSFFTVGRNIGGNLHLEEKSCQMYPDWRQRQTPADGMQRRASSGDDLPPA
ncbi:Hypp8540 [Branchiostoma lanceolatum]|uniref:Hypp8540 protein n=1 Tax=Branchiostoma lanceolatum TaxID=7740 RepID=A0A8J9Z8Z5_BRALA|nr:Hypp8540 [Branchiostoma lanceolatum]